MTNLPEKKQGTAIDKKKEEKNYVLPCIDIYEDQYALYIYADMPGVGKEDLQVELNEDILTIQGKVAKTQPKVMLQEYRIGDYYRSFTLTDEINREKISAKMENGVLCLELPKVEEAKARKIEIRS